MSDAQTPDARTVTDVLLVIDTVTLLARHAHAAPAQRHAEPGEWFTLAPGQVEPDAARMAPWRIDATPGNRVRLRWTPLAMQGEHAVLLDLSPTDTTVFGEWHLHMHADSPRHAPSMGDPEHPALRAAPDVYWQAEVERAGSTELSVELTITDRDANVLRQLQRSLRIEVQ
ncbi:hypothetical protein PMO31116_00317 [Pandoraea morbifera]|uniref:Inclusion body protein n=1 Tax=Pandoraea morbifera TaxID=2508300 RepID=A0A5E4RTG7_9BURK|nr:hypothetical protein [Pandoraea morbifera]VVD65359.1 hypothetical protein PMO31116_00317 [Pandoraea morbifera]